MTTREGYAFPLALAAVAIIALIVAVASTQVRFASDYVATLDRDFQTQLDLRSAEQTLLYLFMTEPIGAYGVLVGSQASIFGNISGQPVDDDVIPLYGNGTPYSYDNSGVFIRYLDGQAFFNAASTEESSLRRLLRANGVSSAASGRMIAAALDFQDDDDQTRSGGAEDAAYPAPDLPPNARLLSPLQLCDIANWRDRPICETPATLSLVSEVRPQDHLNIRFASPFLLRQLLGSRSDAEQARSAILDGTVQNFADLGYPELDETNNPLFGPTGPTPEFVLIVHDAAGGNAWRSTIQLTPANDTSPFLVGSRYLIGGDQVTEALRVSPDEQGTTLPDPGGE